MRTPIVVAIAIVTTVAVALAASGAFERQDIRRPIKKGGESGRLLASGNQDPAGSNEAEVPSERLMTNHEMVLAHDALPCTGPNEPVNFETFSAGPAPAGLPLTGTTRRCDKTTIAGQWDTNYVNYSYGNCKIPRGQTGCSVPLSIQTWPVCQRTMADYEFEGKPLPFRELPNFGDAKVIEYAFGIERRIEVYTGSATIVIFANSQNLARRAVGWLKPQPSGEPPAGSSKELANSLNGRLQAPHDGAMEGELAC